MSEAATIRAADEGPRLDLMDWSEIHEAGCYLHVASGLLARIEAEDLEDDRRGAGHDRPGGLVVRLSSNPRAPIQLLRLVARSHGYEMNS